MEQPRLVFHNAKFDLQKLILAGVLPRDRLSSERIEDTEGIAHLLNEHQEKKLKTLALTVLGIDDTIMVPYKSGQKKGELHAVSREAEHLRRARTKLKLTKEDGFHLLPREVLVPYALKDAEFTLHLFEVLHDRIMDYADSAELYAHEKELILAMLDVEAAGIAVDDPYVDATIKETNLAILKTEREIEEVTGLKVWYPPKAGVKTPEGCFNPNAPEQIKAVFAERGILLPNTKEETFKALDDDLGRLIQALKKDKKLVSTYLLNIKKEERDGLIHPNFKLFKPVTGRMASGKVEE